MSADELTIVISSNREGGNLWMSNRPSIDAPWSPPVVLDGSINSEGNERSPVLSPNCLSLSYVRHGGPHNGVWISTRSAMDAPWSAPIDSTLNIGAINDAELSTDGLSLVLSKRDGLQTNGEQNYKLWIGRRSSTREGWKQSMLTPVGPPVDTDRREAEGTLSEDGRMLLFVRQIESDPVKSKIFVATRSDWDSPWSEPIAIAHQGNEIMTKPRLLPGSKAFLFCSNRKGGSGHGDIWIARLVRKTNPL